MTTLRRNDTYVESCLAVLVILLVSACQPLSSDSIVRSAPIHLLEHKAFLGYNTSNAVSTIDPLLVDERMREFVIRDITEVKNERVRVRALIKKLADHGYYKDYYDAGLTLDANEAFMRKKGNCLSYTHMFIALAREAGLDARYELVEAPPLYSVTDGILEHQVHIRSRVVLPGISSGTSFNDHSSVHRISRTVAGPRVNLKQRYVSVDFNERDIKAYEGWIVSDDLALSLHYANNAVEYWKRRDESKAFTHIVEAIRFAPRYADHWVNLATFYARRELLDESLLINRYALSLDPHHVIALAGVLKNAAKGEMDRAKSRLQRIRHKNPHYQFALAQRSEANQDHLGALAFVDRSIALQKRNHEFLAFKSDVLQSLRRYTQARETLIRANNHVKDRQTRREYARRLSDIEQKIVDMQSSEQSLIERRTEVSAKQGF